MADPPSVFRFDVTFEHVETRSVRRSLETEDDTDPNILWWIRAVPLGHSVMFYLCRNMITHYGEIRYEYSIVNGDAQLETGINRHAVMRVTEMLEEYMSPAISLPVNPRRNWFIVQVKIQHLRPEEYQNHHVEQGAINEEEQFQDDPLEGCSHEFFMSSEQKDIADRLMYMNLFSKRNLEMFTRQLHCDLDVCCGDVVIKAHKSVLSAHAVVFRSMFGYEFTRENQSSTLIIEDYGLYSVLLMLQWCYTGELETLDKEITQLYNIEEVSEKLPEDVLLECTELADKYALDSLQLLCEQQWIDRLRKDNVCLYLVYAEIYQLYSLKMSCVDMISSNPEIIQSSEWDQVRSYGSETARRLESTLKKDDEDEK
ncbi:unnamed protein product [Bursaphelenchus xylophilus]|uniref:(pine wood nematode) hypothetical protein n=1 Tax=Bursaphelenchus xylophilus TaxID=6326 RepID=A0A1I7SM02_BURXY|nr:unnamed protein product [Bursaphelenchus xylophilus]CAG9129950.1 unnamed protein product [Bursaphelenchus xylophilus]